MVVCEEAYLVVVCLPVVLLSMFYYYITPCLEDVYAVESFNYAKELDFNARVSVYNIYDVLSYLFTLTPNGKVVDLLNEVDLVALVSRVMIQARFMFASDKIKFTNNIVY